MVDSSRLKPSCAAVPAWARPSCGGCALRRGPLGRRLDVGNLLGATLAPSRTVAATTGACLARRGHARFEHAHQVGDLGWLLARLGRRDALAFGLRLDDGDQGLAVLVLVALGLELALHGCHELLSHLLLGRLEVEVFLGQLELTDAADLVRPVQGRQEHRLLERVDRGQGLAVLEHDLGDGGQPLVGEHCP